jgi:vanillate O-demethylase ferredoxin subunit
VRQHLITVSVRQIRQLTPRVREYLLSSVDGTKLPSYQAGAHVEVHFSLPESGPVVRHYSLIGGDLLVDDAPDTYRIAVQREDRGRGSAFLHEHLEVGSSVQISVPMNNFPIDRRGNRSLLIAGGIGITPILSMLRSTARRSADFEFVYAGRKLADMAYHDEVMHLAGPHGRIHVSESGSRLDFLALLSKQPVGAIAYVCGPLSMVDAVRSAAQQLGWDSKRVRSELFTAGPTGDEVEFEVEIRKSGRRVRVGRDTTILDALTAAGLHPLHDCRRGECGLCPMTVVEADGPITHNDRYLSAEERASQRTLCICVSRIQGSHLVLDA